MLFGCKVIRVQVKDMCKEISQDKTLVDELSCICYRYWFGNGFLNYTLGPAFDRPERATVVFVQKRNVETLRIVRMKFMDPYKVYAATICYAGCIGFCVIIRSHGGHNSMRRIFETADEAGI